MPATDLIVPDDRYQLVPRTLIFLTCAEHILLVKGAPHKKLWADLYNGLGGHIEQGEDISRAARRELMEESGLEIDELFLAGVITVDTGVNPGIGIFVFRSDLYAENHQEMPSVKPSVEGDIEWVAINKVLELPLVEDLYSLLPVVIAMQPGDEPFSARYSYDDGGHLEVCFNDR